MSADTRDLEATTRDHLQAAFASYHAKHGTRFKPQVRCTFRNSAAQARAYAEGRSQKIPGHSRHNFRPAYAADFLLWDAKEGRYLDGTTTAEYAEYERVGVELEAQGFIWGGRWKDPCDPGHAEARISIEDARAGKTPEWPGEQRKAQCA